MTETVNSCGFCGKRQDEVQKLVAGPTVLICDECITLCFSILMAEGLRLEWIGDVEVRGLIAGFTEAQRKIALTILNPDTGLPDDIRKVIAEMRASLEALEERGNLMEGIT